MKRTLERFGVVFLAFIGYTAMDVMATPLFLVNYPPWFLTWQISLATFSALVGIAYRSITLPLSLIVLAYNGAEDFFYYFLQLKMPPPSLPWLTSPLVFQPASALGTIFGVAWGFALLIILSRIKIPLRKFGTRQLNV